MISRRSLLLGSSAAVAAAVLPIPTPEPWTGHLVLSPAHWVGCDLSAAEERIISYYCERLRDGLTTYNEVRAAEGLDPLPLPPPLRGTLTGRTSCA